MYRRLQPIVLVIMALVCLMTATDASAIYNPRLGQFMQRDPSGTPGFSAAPRMGIGSAISAPGGFVDRDPSSSMYPDGMNLYAAYHVMHGGMDPSGLFQVKVKLGAFIPKSKGRNVRGIPAGRGVDDVKWAKEPGQIFGWWNHDTRYFSTDNREKASEDGTNRVYATMSFDIDKAFDSSQQFGSADLNYTVGVDPSHQIKVGARGAGRYVRGSLRSENGPSGGEAIVYLRAVEERHEPKRIVAAKGELWGKYPFGDAPTFATPAIDITWWMSLHCENGEYTIKVGGKHDNFPAYEVWIQDELAYEWYSPDSGPGILNLNDLRLFRTPRYKIDGQGLTKIEE